MLIPGAGLLIWYRGCKKERYEQARLYQSSIREIPKLSDRPKAVRTVLRGRAEGNRRSGFSIRQFTGVAVEDFPWRECDMPFGRGTKAD